MGRTFTIQVPLRWSDQDQNGHVNNAKVVTLVEEARVAWRLMAVAEGGLDPSITALWVASITVDYRAPVRFGPDLLVDVSVTAVGTRSFTMGFAGNQDEHRVFDATTVMIVPGEGGSSRPLKDFERTYLHAWLEAG